MRIVILWTVVIALIVYAWRNWFVALCGLILLTVVMQRSDFPSYLMGINGLNPWNLLFLSTVLAWFVHRHRAHVRLDIPKRVIWIILAFMLVMFIAYMRCVVDLESFPPEYPQTVVGFTGEFIINRIKFMLPALMLFDACRTRKRTQVAIGIILFGAFCYSLMVIKHVPLSSLLSGSESDFMSYRHRIDRDVGLMAIDMSMLLAGTCWAMVVAAVYLVRRRLLQGLMLVPVLVTFLGMALCHSRGSYIGFAGAGAVLALARWRKMILILPVAGALIFVFLPAIPARLGMGIDVEDTTGEEVQDWDTITAGRMTELWPATIEQIFKSPLIGYGAEACRRTEIRNMWQEAGGATSHPHNAYLFALLEMGLLGFIPTMLLYGGILVISLRLFRNRQNPLAAAIGGMALSAISVLLITALGAQSFYPTQSTVLYWCCWALAMRATVELSRQRTASPGALPRRSGVRPSAGSWAPPAGPSRPADPARA